MLPRVGQNVRVFGLSFDTWVIGRVCDVISNDKETKVLVLIEDWVGFPKNSKMQVSLSNIELICGGFV